MDRTGGVGQKDIWRRFGIGGRTDTVFTEEDNDVRRCQQSPIWSSTSCADTADSRHCQPFPYLSLSLITDAQGTVL